MDDFSFEEEVRLSESDYVALHGVVPRLNRLRLAIAGAIGVAFLFWPYTFLLGVALLLLILLGPLLARTGPGVFRSRYHSEAWLREPFVSGVNSQELWTRGQGFECRFAWRHMNGWQERDGWLWVAGQPGGTAYFKVSSLERAGLYSAFRGLAGAYAQSGQARFEPGQLRHVDGHEFLTTATTLVSKRQPGAAIILERTAGAGFLQIATPEVGEEGSTLEFGIPNAEWARPSWDLLLIDLRGLGYEPLLEAEPKGVGFDTFLRVRVHAPTAELPHHAQAILDLARERMGWPVESQFVVRPVGFSL